MRGTIPATIAPSFLARFRSTLNGASIYLLAKREPDKYQTEKGTPLYQDILHGTLPKGPAGQFSYQLPMTNMLMGYSKQQNAAKKFLAWITSKPIFQAWFNSQGGYTVGATTVWEQDPIWSKDPIMAPFRTVGRGGTLPRLCRTGRSQRRRGAEQVHYHRHVRQGGPGHAGRGRGEVGERRSAEDSRLT